MERVNIVDKGLDFKWGLQERYTTDMVVIHHTGEPDIDASAEQINQWHKNNGWAGIGYHYVIRKDGTVEQGRPAWAVGAHAQGENYHTIGVHLSGDFMHAQPTDAQIESTAMLLANICTDYGIDSDRQHIVGHCDLMPTDCLGDNLYDQLETVIGKANWYANQ